MNKVLVLKLYSKIIDENVKLGIPHAYRSFDELFVYLFLQLCFVFYFKLILF